MLDQKAFLASPFQNIHDLQIAPLQKYTRGHGIFHATYPSLLVRFDANAAPKGVVVANDRQLRSKKFSVAVRESLVVRLVRVPLVHPENLTISRQMDGARSWQVLEVVIQTLMHVGVFATPANEIFVVPTHVEKKLACYI